MLPTLMKLSDESDELDIQDHEYCDVLQVVRRCVKKIKRSSELGEKLLEIQRTMGRNPLNVVVPNDTRWNSVFEMCKRFLRLKDVLILLMETELEGFDWNKLSSICKVLAPFQVIILFLH